MNLEQRRRPGGGLWLVVFLGLVCACGASHTEARPTTEAHTIGDGEGEQGAAESGEPGARLVRERCASCHSLDTIFERTFTAEQWASEVDTMIGRGARLDVAERRTVIDYLTNR